MNVNAGAGKKKVLEISTRNNMSKLVTAVTALKFIKSTSDNGQCPERYLFAATGNQVQVFIGEAEEPSAIEEVFPAEYRIHGFSDVVNNCMLIYGGRIVALARITFSSNDVTLTLQERIEFDDWVWGVHWLSDGRMVAVACGHSTTYICETEDLQNSFMIQSEEKELTWSANLFSNSHGLCAVAGSSFGDVLSWTLLDPAQLEHAATHLLSKQHKKDPPSDKLLPVHRLSAHDGPVMHMTVSPDSQRLATASVDRSVRVWEVRKSDCIACAGGCFEPVLVHYGHLARVWDVSFITKRSVASVGEDHSCRVWGDQSGKEIACYHGHAGRNIWSVAVCDGLVATGGEDGGVKVRSLSATVTKGPFRLTRFENLRKKGAFNESGRTIVMIDHETLLITTDFGRILRGRFGSEMEWTEVFRDDNGTAFTPCSLVVCGELIVAGQSDGNVLVLRAGQKIGALKGDGMVMGLFAETGPQGCDVLIASANGTLSHWLVGEDESVIEFGKYRMERPVKTCLVTAACIARDAELVITGDRGGRVVTYPLLTREWKGDMVHPVGMIRPHKDRVSSVDYSTKSILTSGFDGAVIRMELNKEGKLDTRCVSRAPDRTDTITKYENGRILGFRGSTAVFWELESRSEWIRADVGNWRRAHDVYMSMKNCAVGYWRGGGVYITHGGDAGWGMSGGHGGRVCGIGVVDNGFVTGGEDGVCIWRDGKVMQRLTGHTSVVHDVASNGGMVASVGGKDELYIWENCEGAWRELWRCVVGEFVEDCDKDGMVERGLCVGFDDGIVVGRSDGSVVKIVDGVGKVVMRVDGGVLCVDCSNGIIVVGDTRGFVNILNDGGIVDQVLVHDGGVNDVKIVHDGWISCGDDGYVKYYNKSQSWKMIWCGIKHTAGVTGLTIGEEGMIYSVGADQRIVSWTLSGNCTMTTTSIVDASSICYTTSGQLMVAGIGVQWIDICS